MTLNTFVQTLARRWYLTVLGILLTVGVCIWVAAIVPPTYEARANVLLLPPESSVSTGGNPYLQLGGLTQVVDVLAKALSSQAMTDQVGQQHPSATFIAESDFTTSGPILVLTADDRTAAATRAVLGELNKAVPSSLEKLQSGLGIARRAQITSMVLTIDDEPTPIQKTRIRVLVASAAIGLIGTALLVGLTDGMIRRRRLRRTGVELPKGHERGAETSAELRAAKLTTQQDLAELALQPGANGSQASNGAVAQHLNGSTIAPTSRQNGSTRVTEATVQAEPTKSPGVKRSSVRMRPSRRS